MGRTWTTKPHHNRPHGRKSVSEGWSHILKTTPWIRCHVRSLREIRENGACCNRVADTLSSLLTCVWRRLLDHTHTASHLALPTPPRCHRSLRVLSGVVFDSRRARAPVRPSLPSAVHVRPGSALAGRWGGASTRGPCRSRLLSPEAGSRLRHLSLLCVSLGGVKPVLRPGWKERV